MKQKFAIITAILILCCYSSLFSQASDVKESKQQIIGKALQGWGNWENRHLYTWVKMPDGLALKLLFRNREGGWPYWLTETYIGNKNKNAKGYTFHMDITPLAQSYDGSYTESILTWEDMTANIKSAVAGDDVYILYSPIDDPSKLSHAMMLSVGTMWNKPGKIYHQNDHIVAELTGKTIEVKTTKKSKDIGFNVMAPHYFHFSDEQVAFYTGEDKTHEEVLAIIENNRNEYHSRKKQFGNLAEPYNAMKNVVAHNLVYDPVNKRPFISVSRSWNESWGGYVLFDWDTYFAALMAAVDDKNIAYANAIAITDEITEKGFIPNVAAIWDKKSNDRSQPPVGSMVCKMIYEKYPEKEFLVSVYDNLLTWNRWWDQNRNHQGYLSWGSNPVQDGLGKQHTKHAGQLESGLDNSPLFDSVDFNEETHMLELGSVGLMGLYIGDCKALADIADELGKNDDARELRKRAKKYSKKLKTMWDEETGIYRDVYLKNGKFSTHLAPTNFYSLISGVPTQKQAERMIEEHYFNEEEFYGEWVMPSISRDNLAFGDNSYWRGRIWAPMNFLVYMGMRNYDLPEARKDLADKSVKLIMKEWTDHNLVFENYNSTTGVGGDVRNSNPYYSWGALLSFIGLWEYGYWDE